MENVILCGDCLRVLPTIPEGSVDLIYLDPPFFSGRNYEIIWPEDGYERRQFEDRWKGGIENYTAWLEARIRECHRVLKPSGSMYTHCDWHANAHIRIMLDKVFGEGNFLNEIIWWYHDPAGTVKDRFKKKHDSIYFYAKNADKHKFNMDAVRTPYSEGTMEQARNGVISFGRKTKVNPLGKVPEDVWEIPFINSQSKERLGYPTQKPEALLERIIKASSSEGEMVLDPFCGCGTTIATALKFKRKWIGIDVSPTACKLMGQRIHKIMPGFDSVTAIQGLPKSMDQLRSLHPFEFQNWVIDKMMGRSSPKKTSDMGIDGYLFDGSPIQVKQSEGVGRNIVDNFETAMRRIRRKKGYIVAFSFGRGAYEEVARAKSDEDVEIILKEVKSIVEEVG